jgi:hypothetical protein
MKLVVASLIAAGVGFTASIAAPTGARAENMTAGMARNLCMDVNQNVMRIELHPCHKGANQTFFTTSYGQQRFNGRCLDTESDREGAQLIMAACSNSKRTQKWALWDDGTFRNETGHCADIPGANAFAGQKVVQWKCGTRARNQIFGRGKLLSAPEIASITGKSLMEVEALMRGNSILSHNGGVMVAAGGGNMVAAGGGNMVAAGGGNMVAAGGGNMIRLNGGAVIQ